MMTGIARLLPSAAASCGLSLCVFGVLGAVVIAPRPAAAGDASPWNGDARSSVRLVADAPADPASALRAGIELRLEPGWHTYWRYPGDAGVPPHFDFAGSQNVKAVTVLWPAPQRIEEQGMTAIGYVGDVVWPLAIVPQNPEKPVMLRLELDYAVCEKLCVPAQGKAELTLDAHGASADAALARARARVPKKSVLGAGGAPLAIRSLRRESGAARPRIIVDVAAPVGADVALFVEGPSPDWALPIPVAIAGAPDGLQRFAFDLDGAPPGAKYEGALVTLTAVAGNNAIEVATHLD